MEGTEILYRILAWRIPRTEDPGGFHQVQRVRQDWNDLVLKLYYRTTELLGHSKICIRTSLKTFQLNIDIIFYTFKSKVKISTFYISFKWKDTFVLWNWGNSLPFWKLRWRINLNFVNGWTPFKFYSTSIYFCGIIWLLFCIVFMELRCWLRW